MECYHNYYKNEDGKMECFKCHLLKTTIESIAQQDLGEFTSQKLPPEESEKIDWIEDRINYIKRKSCEMGGVVMSEELVSDLLYQAYYRGLEDEKFLQKYKQNLTPPQ